MNTAIFKSLKEDFSNSTNVNNRSLVELCIIELSSGNFSKAIDLSEELVKKDINDSTGWAMKALSQAYLFDYNNNQHILKSSFASLEEFKSRTSLPQKVKMDVEAIFITTVLARTIVLVGERLEEATALYEKAEREKVKSVIASVATAYATTKFKSNTDKLFVFVAGNYAGSQFQDNADELTEASKGLFGIAVANMVATIEPAKFLKTCLSELSFEVCNEATNILQVWIKILADLYQAVIASLRIYVKEALPNRSLFKKSDGDEEAMVNVINSPEAVQFIYLSKLLGLDSTIPGFDDIMDKMESVKNISVDEAKSDKRMGTFIAIAPFLGLLLVAGLSSEEQADQPSAALSLVFLLLPILGVGLLYYFSINPYGRAGLLHSEVKSLKDTLDSFQFSAQHIIIENIGM